VSRTGDIYLLKNLTANIQRLDQLVTIDRERAARRESSLLNWANKVYTRCSYYHWKMGRARPLAADHEDDAQAPFAPTT